MKTTLDQIRKTGYGHYELTITYSNGKTYKCVTTDTQTIDDYRSESFSVAEEKAIKRAEKALIRQVKRANKLR